jgi:acyl-CoA thioester hydrolase
MTSAPEGFRHRILVEIRFADLDALGHVNNAVYFTYMETARVHYFRDLALWDGIPNELGPIMAKAVIDYKLPLDLSDRVAEVFTRCVRIGSKSMELEHLIRRTRGGQTAVAAAGTIIGVAYNYVTNESILVPESWREKIQRYEAPPG